MDSTQFLAIVEKVGADNIMGIMFDNSAIRMIREDRKFTLDDNYDPDIQCLKFQEFDVKGNIFWVYKSVADIQGFIVRDGKIAFSAYDRVSLRG